MIRKGRFSPRFPQKYLGNPCCIFFRSGWELRVMSYLDKNENILGWSSEEVIIPYLNPFDLKKHLYFPDFFVRAKTKDGRVTESIWEVKPLAQTKPPKGGRRKTRRYLAEVYRFGINQAKFEAAERYCAEKGWKFRIISEEAFGIPNK